MTTDLTKDRVLDELKRIEAPGPDADIVSAGLVSEIVINKGKSPSLIFPRNPIAPLIRHILRED